MVGSELANKASSGRVCLGIVRWNAIRTIESVGEGTTRIPQLGPDHLLRRHDTVEDKAQEVVGKRPKGNLPADKATDAILGPRNLGLELGPREVAGTQQRRRRATRDVIAAKEQGPQKHRETEDDGGRAGTVERQQIALPNIGAFDRFQSIH